MDKYLEIPRFMRLSMELFSLHKCDSIQRDQVNELAATLNIEFEPCSENCATVTDCDCLKNQYEKFIYIFRQSFTPVKNFQLVKNNENDATPICYVDAFAYYLDERNNLAREGISVNILRILELRQIMKPSQSATERVMSHVANTVHQRYETKYLYKDVDSGESDADMVNKEVFLRVNSNMVKLDTELARQKFIEGNHLDALVKNKMKSENSSTVKNLIKELSETENIKGRDKGKKRRRMKDSTSAPLKKQKLIRDFVSQEQADNTESETAAVKNDELKSLDYKMFNSDSLKSSNGNAEYIQENSGSIPRAELCHTDSIIDKPFMKTTSGDEICVTAQAANLEYTKVDHSATVTREKDVCQMRTCHETIKKEIFCKCRTTNKFFHRAKKWRWVGCEAREKCQSYKKRMNEEKAKGGDWFHLYCVGLKDYPVNEWYCNACIQNKKDRLYKFKENSKIKLLKFRYSNTAENTQSVDASELNKDYLQMHLKKEGRQVKKILGDGNCAFRALAYDYFGNEDRHIEMRQKISDVLINLLDSDNLKGNWSIDFWQTSRKNALSLEKKTLYCFRCCYMLC